MTSTQLTSQLKMEVGNISSMIRNKTNVPTHSFVLNITESPNLKKKSEKKYKSSELEIKN